jgi:hypothetical protein
LFPAPFKIMALAHPKVWRDDSLAAVLMPTGTQVNRALRMLSADRIIKIEATILDGGVGTFADEYTNLWALQLPQQQLAKLAGVPALHINTALYELGQKRES